MKVHRYSIQLAYDGTHYHGWQIQPNGISVQEELQKALSTILREEVKVVGCGRTDTGVHASYFVAHFDLPSPIKDTDKLQYKLNSFLPASIVIYSLKESSKEFHARFSATSRSYQYHVITRKNPFLTHTAYRLPFELDFEAMNRAAKHLFDYTDFTSFSKLHSDVHTNNCTIKAAYWEQIDHEHWVFNITADRFLRNMVRAIVGTLFEIGKGKLDETAFCNIIEAQHRGKAGVSVPAQGLFLTDVCYPEGYINR